jgi:hypothetical protein
MHERVLVWCVAMALGACGEGGSSTSPGSGSGTLGDDTSASAGVTSAATGEADPPATGPLAPGWQKAFAPEPAGINCVMTAAEMAAAGAPSLSFGEATIYVGFEQIGQNQDPVFARFDGGVQTYCEHHERESPDGRAYGLTWDGGPVAYVVYSMVGGGSAFDSKAKGTWLDRYGDGGASAKVSFIGEVETQFGTLTRGTFVIARKMDGKTNTHGPADAITVLVDGRLEFHGESAFRPMNPDRSTMECSDYPFFSKYVFNADLTALECSSCTNCVSAVPCPE